MPAQPRWLLRLPQIIEELSALEAPVVDRATVERLFGLRRRQAINVLRAFGGYQLGKTALIDRVRMLEYLRGIAGGERFAFERRRRERLADQLERVRKRKRAASVTIQPEPEPAPDATLPAGVHLEAGRLTINFQNVQDLLEKLYGIAQAAAEDFDRFRSATGAKN